MNKGRALGLALMAAAVAPVPPATAAEATMFCTNAGNRYQVGDYACLPACHGRQRYARCDAISQAASWTYISDVCPMALLAPPIPSDVTLAPVQTAMSPIPIDVTTCAIAPELEPRIRG